jgi:subtilisin-like proprotein convertase family protein
MQSQFSLAYGPAVLAMQRERLQPEVTVVPPRTTAPRRRIALAANLVASLLVLLLLDAAAPAFAGHSHRDGQALHQQGQPVAVAKKQRGKTKTITRTFSNGAEIAVPAAGAVDDFGPADPYPSTIEVTDFKKAKVADVNLTLRGFSHEFTRDVDVLLVAPDGRNAVVMGDVGPASGGPVDVANLSISLDDEAAAPLPIAADVALTSGTFQPLDNLGPHDADDPDDPILTAFPAPAPEASGNSDLSTFDGIDPNGQWRLFVLDDTDIDAGVIAGGWSLEITAKSKVKAKDKPKHKRGRQH